MVKAWFQIGEKVVQVDLTPRPNILQQILYPRQILRASSL